MVNSRKKKSEDVPSVTLWLSYPLGFRDQYVLLSVNRPGLILTLNSLQQKRESFLLEPPLFQS